MNFRFGVLLFVMTPLATQSAVWTLGFLFGGNAAWCVTAACFPLGWFLGVFVGSINDQE